jgi:ABC-type multidrug transport system ATPase subunit
MSEAMAVRRDIGVTAQDATVDPMLTGRQNLVMIGRLAGLRRRQARATAADLLARFDLTHAADQVLKAYSGGMRRRLDLAAGIVTRPPVLFLDEPTTGLDPVSRQAIWNVVADLVADGTTVLLTTQYLDEADQLADRIAVINHGRVVAEGTARSLKSRIGHASVEVSLSRPDPRAAGVLASFAAGPVTADHHGLRLRAGVASASGLATAIVRALDAEDITVDDVAIRPPSLDDVFFALAGQAGSPVAAAAR